jgi:hypothetical protein
MHTEDVNNSTDARFSTDDRSLSGGGIPNVKASIPDLVTEVKDIKTDLKDIKTEAKKMVYAFQAIQKEKALQTSQRKEVIDGIVNAFLYVTIGVWLVIGGMCIYVYFVM